MSKEIQAKGRGGKRWEAAKTRQSFGTNCSAKCAKASQARLRYTKKPNCEFRGPLKSTFVPKASLWLQSGAGVEPRSRKAAPLSDLWRIELACGSQRVKVVRKRHTAL